MYFRHAIFLWEDKMSNFKNTKLNSKLQGMTNLSMITIIT